MGTVRRIAIVAAVSVLVLAGSLHAQSATGMYSGTFTVFVTLPPGCTNISSFSYSGHIEGQVIQSGSNLAATFIMSDPTFVKNENGICTGFRPSSWDGGGYFTSGKVSNGAVSANFIMFGIDPPVEGTVSGSTFSVHGKNSGKGLSFQMTRTSTTVLPLIAFGNSRPGVAMGPANIYWTTAGATTVSIRWTSFSSLFGEFAGLPRETNTYFLTATGPTGTATATTTVKVALQAAADVVVSVSPLGIVQEAGSPPRTDSFTLTNLGGTATDVTLTTSSSLFTVTPATFRLEAIDSRVVSVAATTQEAGSLHGFVSVSGTGVAPGLIVPIHRLIAQAPPAGVPVTSAPRRDVSAPLGQNSSGTVAFTNSGASPVTGVVIADVPWIGVPSPDLTLGPGETREVALAIDRARRPGRANGGALGGASFRYLDAAGSAGAAGTAVVDAVESVPVPFAPAQLVPGGPFMMFTPGASRRPQSFTDLHLSNRLIFNLEARPVAFPADGGVGGAIDLVLAPLASISFPRVMTSLFGSIPETGTLVILGQALSFLSIAHTQVNTKDGVTTVTTLPTFRSDQGFAGGEELFLTGVRKSDTQTTTLVLQEMSGAPGGTSVAIDFFDSEGSQLAPSRTQTIPRLGSIELPDAAPSHTTTVRVKNTTAGTLINGYALVVDKESGDAFAVVQLNGTGTLFTLAAAGDPGKEIAINLANAGAEPITATATKCVLDTARRRGVAPGTVAIPGGLIPAATVTIPAFGSRRLLVSSAATGFVRVTGPSALRAASMVSTPGPGQGRVGSGVAVIPASRALTSGGGMRFAGVEDSSAATTAAKRPLTYRTKLFVQETSGRDTRVKITIRYALPGGNPDNAGAHTKDYLVLANGGFAIFPVAEDIIGSPRDALGDLHNATIDVEVVATSNPGTVIAFLQMIDNGTGEVNVRHD